MSTDLVRFQSPEVEAASSLADCERRIEESLRAVERAVRAFQDAGERASETRRLSALEVGAQLLLIHEARLYKETHKSFERYLDERWNYSRSRGYELMDGAKTVRNSEIADILPPANEGQARALNAVPEEQRAMVMEKAAESGKVTAASITEAARTIDEPEDVEAEIVRELNPRVLDYATGAAVAAYQHGYTLPEIQNAIATAIGDL